MARLPRRTRPLSCQVRTRLRQHKRAVGVGAEVEEQIARIEVEIFVSGLVHPYEENLTANPAAGFELQYVFDNAQRSRSLCGIGGTIEQRRVDIARAQRPPGVRPGVIYLNLPSMRHLTLEPYLSLNRGRRMERLFDHANRWNHLS